MKKMAYTFIDEERIINPNHELMVGIHIADIHMGALDPKYQYEIMKEQCINRLEEIQFDYIAINGDLTHHKLMSNSPVIFYTMKLIDDIVNLCRRKKNNPTIILISGTYSHDAGQMRLFNNYLTDNSIDFRIIEDIKFEYIKDAKVLCIPEVYNHDKEFYDKFLCQSYDFVLMHGTYEGAKPYISKQESEIHSGRAPVFTKQDFANCRIFVASGHIHTAMLLDGFFQYSGSTFVWAFGEEEDKGFIISIFNLRTRKFYNRFIKIKSKQYVTIDISRDLEIMEEPSKIVTSIDEYKNEVDYIRLKVSLIQSKKALVNLDILKNYYRSNNKVKIFITKKAMDNYNLLSSAESIEDNDNNISLDIIENYSFLLDDSYTDKDKFVMYVNKQEGQDFLSIKEFNQLMEGRYLENGC